MRPMPPYQARQSLARLRAFERNGKAATRDMERRYYANQAQTERDALALHGFRVVEPLASVERIKGTP